MCARTLKSIPSLGGWLVISSLALASWFHATSAGGRDAGPSGRGPAAASPSQGTPHPGAGAPRAENDVRPAAAPKNGVVTEDSRPDRPDLRSLYESLEHARLNGPAADQSLSATLARLHSDLQGLNRFHYPLVAGVPVKVATKYDLRIPDRVKTWMAERGLPLPEVPEGQVWRSLGPDGFGGRTRCLVIAPANASTPVGKLEMWAGSAGGGIWHTADGGENWKPVGQFVGGNLAVSSLALCKPAGQPLTLYAGTGEGFANYDSIQGNGVYVSRDGGLNWNVLTGTLTCDFSYVNRLAVSGDGKVLLAATGTGILRSERVDLIPGGGGGAAAVLDRLDFVHARSNQPAPDDIADPMADVKFADEQEGAHAVAGGLDNGAAYYSIDGGRTWGVARHDGQWVGRVELAYAMHDPTVVYAAACLTSADGSRPFRSALWMSTDGGRSYTQLGAKYNGRPLDWLGKQDWYGNTLWAYARHRGNKLRKLPPDSPSGPSDLRDDRNADNVIIVGGVQLWRSVDNGNSFVPISGGDEGRSPHADNHAIVPVPNFGTEGEDPESQPSKDDDNPDPDLEVESPPAAPAPPPAKVAHPGRHHFQGFVCTDGGIFGARDLFTVGNGEAQASGWKPRNRGFAVAQFYGAAASRLPDKHLLLIAGAQDLGTLITREVGSPRKWTVLAGGDGGFCAADPRSPGHFYCEFQNLAVCRASDAASFVEDISGAAPPTWDEGTATWQERWKVPPYLIEDARDQKCGFIAPFVVDPNGADCLLAGGHSLWRTRDARARVADATGPKWRPIKDPILDPSGRDAAPVSAIAVASGNSDLIWVGYANGAVYRTADGCRDRPHWTEVNDLGDSRLPRGRACNRIFIRPAGSDHVPLGKVVFAVFGGYEPDNVWRTEDGGDTWKPVGIGADVGSLPVAPVYGLTTHPDHAACLYAATEVGVYASEDNGESWLLTDQAAVPGAGIGPTNCSVRDLFWEDRTLYAVTHSRGLFSIEIPYTLDRMPVPWLEDRARKWAASFPNDHTAPAATQPGERNRQ